MSSKSRGCSHPWASCIIKQKATMVIKTLTIHRYQGIEGEGFIYFLNRKDLSPTCINRHKNPIHISMIPPTLDGQV